MYRHNLQSQQSNPYDPAQQSNNSNSNRNNHRGQEKLAQSLSDEIAKNYKDSPAEKDVNDAIIYILENLHEKYIAQKSLDIHFRTNVLLKCNEDTARYYLKKFLEDQGFLNIKLTREDYYGKTHVEFDIM